MPRFEIASRLAFVGALLVPALATGQAVEPLAPKPSPAAEAAGPGLFIRNLDAGAPTTFHVEALQPRASRPDNTTALWTGLASSWNSSVWKDQDDNPLLARYGLDLAEADDALRSQLEIPAGEGVVVVTVKPGSLAEHAGLKPNDVLTDLGEEKAGDVKASKKILLDLGKKALEVKLVREGKRSRMSLVGPEHGFPSEAAEFWIGVPVSPVDATLRAHLPSLAAEAGLIANDVVKGSPADKAGFQKNDILATMAGKPLKNSAGLVEQIQTSGGKSVPVEIFRAGKALTVAVTPEKRIHPTTIKYRTLASPLPTNPQSYITAREYYVVKPHVGVEVGSPQTFAFHGTNPKVLGEKPIDIQLQVRQVEAKPADEATGRIEAQLKEMSARLAEIQKAIEGLKKPEGK